MDYPTATPQPEEQPDSLQQFGPRSPRRVNASAHSNSVMKLPKRIVWLYKSKETKQLVDGLGHSPVLHHDPAQQHLHVSFKQVAQAQAELEQDRQQLETEKHMLQATKLQLQAERELISQMAENYQLHQQDLLLHKQQHAPITALGGRQIGATQTPAEVEEKPDTGAAGGTAVSQSFDPSLGPAAAAAAASAAQEAVHQAIHDGATAAAAAAAAAATAQQYYYHLQLQDNSSRCASPTQPTKYTIAAPPSAASPANDILSECPMQQTAGGQQQQQHPPPRPLPSQTEGLSSSAQQTGLQAASTTTSCVADAGGNVTDSANTIISTSTRVGPGNSTLTIRTSLDNSSKPVATVLRQSPQLPASNPTEPGAGVLNLQQLQALQQQLEQRKVELAMQQQRLDNEAGELYEWSQLLRGRQQSLEQRERQLQQREARAAHL